MIISIKLVIMAVFYIVFKVIVYHDAVETYRWFGMLAEREALHMQIFVMDSLFNLQQIMFIQTFFFVMYLFVIHKPITTPTFILRCQPHYFRKLGLIGLKRAGSYSIFVIIVSTLIPIIYGSPIEFNMGYFVASLQFFLIIWTMFLIYVTLLLVIKQEVLSMVGIGIINFVISLATLATWSDFVQMVVLNLYIVLGMGLMGFIYFKCKKGEFI